MEGVDSDEDLFEDAVSDFPEAFPNIQPSPTKEPSPNYHRELEDSSSLNDDSSLASGELLLHPVKGA